MRVVATAGHVDPATGKYPSFSLPTSSKYYPAALLASLGYTLGDNQLNDAFRRFKDIADRKKTVFDEDIVAHVPPSAKHFDHSGNFGRTADVSVEPVWPGIGDAHAQ